MLRKIFTLLIVLYPILSAYIVVGPIDLGVALCAMVGSILFASVGFHGIKLPDGYGAFLIYLLFVSSLVTHAFPARVLLYSFLFVMGCHFCNISLLLKYYKRVVFVCIILFVIQEILRLTTGTHIPGIFTFLPVVYGDSASYIQSVILQSDRSSSFFLEPSYFAQFLSSLIVLELFYNKSKYQMKNAIFLTLVTLMVRSGNGMFLLAIIWGIWLFFSDVKRRTKHNIFVAIGITGIILIMYNHDLVFSIIARSNELSVYGTDEQWQTSGFIRFWRGYYLYGSMPSLNQLFGMNPSEINIYMRNNALGLFDSDSSFINGVQTILCLYGVVGLLFLFRYLYLSGEKANLTIKVLLVSTIYLLFSESYFISGRMLVVMIIIFLLKYQKNENSLYN